jgi:hypothetical protein
MGYLNIYNINKFILVFDLKYKKNTFFFLNFPEGNRPKSSEKIFIQNLFLMRFTFAFEFNSLF